MEKRGLLPGVLTILLGVVLCLVIWLSVGNSEHLEKGWGPIWGGIYMYYIGVVFLLSYFFPNESFLFRGIMWICKHFSVPSGEKMAFFYASLAFILGTLVIMIGVGIIDEKLNLLMHF
jgi:hypothetical protein